MQFLYGLTREFLALRSLIGLSRDISSAQLRQGLRRPHSYLPTVCSMKRSNEFATASPTKKPKTRPRLAVPDYCDVEPRRDDAGRIIWPAPANAIEEARTFIKEWY